MRRQNKKKEREKGGERGRGGVEKKTKTFNHQKHNKIKKHSENMAKDFIASLVVSRGG